MISAEDRPHCDSMITHGPILADMPQVIAHHAHLRPSTIHTIAREMNTLARLIYILPLDAHPTLWQTILCLKATVGGDGTKGNRSHSAANTNSQRAQQKLWYAPLHSTPALLGEARPHVQA